MSLLSTIKNTVAKLNADGKRIERNNKVRRAAVKAKALASEVASNSVPRSTQDKVIMGAYVTGVAVGAAVITSRALTTAVCVAVSAPSYMLGYGITKTVMDRRAERKYALQAVADNKDSEAEWAVSVEQYVPEQ